MVQCCNACIASSEGNFMTFPHITYNTTYNHRPKMYWTQYGNPFLEANISATKPPTKAFELPPNLFFRQTLVGKFHAIKAGFSSCSPPKFLKLKDCYSCLSLLFVTRVSSFKILINPFKAYF